MSAQLAPEQLASVRIDIWKKRVAQCSMALLGLLVSSASDLQSVDFQPRFSLPVRCFVVYPRCVCSGPKRSSRTRSAVRQVFVVVCFRAHITESAAQPTIEIFYGIYSISVNPGPDLCSSVISMPLTFLTVWFYQAEQTRPYLIPPLFPVEEVKHTHLLPNL